MAWQRVGAELNIFQLRAINSTRLFIVLNGGCSRLIHTSEACIRWAHLMLGTWFFSCCLKKMMNIKCAFKLYQQMLLLVGEKLSWVHIWRRNVSNVFWKAFWSWQSTFVFDLLFDRHSDQALITLASITYCTLRSHVKSTTVSITRHFNHYLKFCSDQFVI